MTATSLLTMFKTQCETSMRPVVDSMSKIWAMGRVRRTVGPDAVPAARPGGSACGAVLYGFALASEGLTFVLTPRAGTSMCAAVWDVGKKLQQHGAVSNIMRIDEPTCTE